MAVVYHLTLKKHIGVDIDDLSIRLGAGRYTDSRTLEATNPNRSEAV